MAKGKPIKERKVIAFLAYVPPSVLKDLDVFADKFQFPSRAEFVRRILTNAVRRMERVEHDVDTIGI